VSGGEPIGAVVCGWPESVPPDVVSVNLVQEDAVELGRELPRCGIGIEAGVFCLANTESLLAAPWAAQVHRVLVEILDEEDDGDAAVTLPRDRCACRVARPAPPLGRPVPGRPGRSWTPVAAHGP
jgi:hypothetical protein